MRWRSRIERKPGVMLGKPVIKGTRITVEHILMCFGSGWTEDQLLHSCPHLNVDGIRAALIFAAKSQRSAWRKPHREVTNVATRQRPQT